MVKIIYFIFNYNFSILKIGNDSKGNSVKQCRLDFSTNVTISQPIHVYYELTNYLTNHREYVKSRSWPQLEGQNVSFSSISDSCKGMTSNSNAFGNDTSLLVSFTGNPLDSNATLSPCGLIAKNYFNDYFRLYMKNSKNQSELIQIPINETGIAYAADKKYYKRAYNYSTTQWVDVENEHFMVWMQMETFTDFRKLWGRIEKPLEPGNYQLVVDYNWDHPLFQTGKKFVISSSQGLGSASFFGYTLIKGGGICLISIFIMCLTKATQKNKFDPEDLQWN
jgi:hypothetical protein